LNFTKKTAILRYSQTRLLKKGIKGMSENQNTEGLIFGPEVINADAIEALSDEVVDELLEMLTKAGY
jgi:hypothetical protein